MNKECFYCGNNHNVEVCPLKRMAEALETIAQRLDDLDWRQYNNE